jgi:predicted transposase/invertase (TIGR01784 family)
MYKRNYKITAKSDVFFRYLFGMPENEDLLVDFINAVFRDSGGKTIRSAMVVNPFNLKESFDEKETILDIKAISDDGRFLNIELQVVGNESYRKRIAYYIAKLHSSQLTTGDEYDKIAQTVAIHIVDFELEKGDKNIHNCYHLYSENNKTLCLTDDLEVHVLELPKLRNNAKIDKRLFGWLEFFEEEEEGKNMDAVIEKNPKLTRAQELFKRFTENEELNRYEARVKYERDLKYWKKCIQEQIRNEIKEEIRNEIQEECRDEGITIGREEGISIGLSQGITQGAHQKAVETAKVLKSAGVEIGLIINSTGLSVEEIEKL